MATPEILMGLGLNHQHANRIGIMIMRVNYDLTPNVVIKQPGSICIFGQGPSGHVFLPPGSLSEPGDVIEIIANGGSVTVHAAPGEGINFNLNADLTSTNGGRMYRRIDAENWARLSVT